MRFSTPWVISGVSGTMVSKIKEEAELQMDHKNAAEQIVSETQKKASSADKRFANVVNAKVHAIIGRTRIPSVAEKRSEVRILI